VRDHLWIRLVDLPTALSQRGYPASGSLVLEVADPFCPWNEGRWRLQADPDGAECRAAAAGDDVQLRLDAAALGPVFLGGASIARLTRAGRVEGDRASLRLADRMFRSDSEPWCSTEF
jgi:predicted acetyltransferase